MRMPKLADAALLSELAEFLSQFREGFHRRDQARWAELYLYGLLLPGGRKNVEGLARQVAPLAGRPIADVAQALQNLVGQSPWNEDLLWRRYRAVLARKFAAADGVLVIEDLVFPKQGAHSVGVQRQYSAALGRKINCQIAVAVHFVGPRVSFPLALRLYLPARWLRVASRLDVAGVPAHLRTHRTRAEIALDLLDVLRGEGLACRYAVAGSAYGAGADFREGLSQRGFSYIAEVPADFAVGEPSVQSRVSAMDEQVPRRQFGPVSLRSLARELRWPAEAPGSRSAARLARIRAQTEQGGGCSEAVDVFLINQGNTATPYALGNLSDKDNAEVLRIWRSRDIAEREHQRLKDELGLDHFEGRSWRGVHHHTCLVALAHGYRLLQHADSRKQASSLATKLTHSL
jgi:SRSO17 transposase